jgi:hypothetical protein
MQQQDLSTLIAELSASLISSTPSGQSATAAGSIPLQQKIAPILTADLQQSIVAPVVVTAPVVPPVLPGTKTIDLNSAFAHSNAVLVNSPIVFKSISAGSVIAHAVEKAPSVAGSIGASLSNMIHAGLGALRFPLFTDETISVFFGYQYHDARFNRSGARFTGSFNRERTAHQLYHRAGEYLDTVAVIMCDGTGGHVYGSYHQWRYHYFQQVHVAGE